MRWVASGVRTAAFLPYDECQLFSFPKPHKGDHVEYLYFIKAGQVFLNISDVLCFLTSQKRVSKVV